MDPRSATACQRIRNGSAADPRRAMQLRKKRGLLSDAQKPVHKLMDFIRAFQRVPLKQRNPTKASAWEAEEHGLALFLVTARNRGIFTGDQEHELIRAQCASLKSGTDALMNGIRALKRTPNDNTRRKGEDGQAECILAMRLRRRSNPG